MSTAHVHRLVELLIGLSLLALCGYEIKMGHTIGTWRRYSREETPWSYWTSLLLQAAILAAFLFGYTSWR